MMHLCVAVSTGLAFRRLSPEESNLSDQSVERLRCSWSVHIAQVTLELRVILLPLVPEDWD